MLPRTKHESVCFNLLLVTEPGYSQDIYDLVKERSIISLLDYDDPDSLNFDGLDYEVQLIVDGSDQLNFFQGGKEESDYAGISPDNYKLAISDTVKELTTTAFHRNSLVIDAIQEKVNIQDVDAVFNRNGVIMLNLTGTRA